MAGPQTRYPEEFKREAVRLYRSGVRGAIDKTASAIGVGHGALRLWVRQTDIDAGEAEGLTTDERKDLTRLRRENEVLKEKREILKKERDNPNPVDAWTRELQRATILTERSVSPCSPLQPAATRRRSSHRDPLGRSIGDTLAHPRARRHALRRARL